jgi:sporulation protein YlmC with PRC-barrel domain
MGGAAVTLAPAPPNRDLNQGEASMRTFGPMTDRPWAEFCDRRTIFSLAAVFGVLGVIPGPAFSQTVQFLKVDVSVVGKGIPVSKLSGQSVVNDKNETVGKIDDVVIGDDHSLFTILQVGGFLGLNSRLVAVPYDSLKIQEDNGRVQKIALPGASRDELKRLAEFRYPS